MISSLTTIKFLLKLSCSIFVNDRYTTYNVWKSRQKRITSENPLSEDIESLEGRHLPFGGRFECQRKKDGSSINFSAASLYSTRSHSVTQDV